MIGILFFLFEFYDDQLLAFMVLILVWLCELFTLIRSFSLPYVSAVCILCMFMFIWQRYGIVLQRPNTNIDEVLPSVLSALFSGFSHLLLLLCLWYVASLACVNYAGNTWLNWSRWLVSFSLFQVFHTWHSAQLQHSWNTSSYTSGTGLR